MYLGDIAQCYLQKLNAAGAFLSCRTQISGVQTAHLSQIDGDCDASEVADIIRSIAPAASDVTPADIDTMRRVSQAVTCRAARLTAAGIAAVIDRSSWYGPVLLYDV